ncbi:efflux RND transporter periplasmic adaptor subunit [Clostridium boliviensis]|uniref:Efflux RND transporter periplasmic adaptor subunit n=1 Tax=Clostridium boliviensis TaxID=318465 RepID=A0ABU4GM11_9CLOT|nr:efflux RND transporter periplasmic adaptor subunit [Clostridium boliviensis]MDW2798651.1 efflux RND transporter periplasmic adaptor subunit [Clostridium boliviensis]
MIVRMRIFIWAAVLCALLLTGCNDKQEKKEVRSISVATVSDAAYTDTLNVSGNVTPVETANLSFKLDGKLKEVYVREGDAVEMGQKVAELSMEDYTLQVRAAQAQLRAAEAQYATAKMQLDTDVPSKIAQAKAQFVLTQKTYNRVKVLYEAQAVSQSDLDEISAKLAADSETYHQALEGKNMAAAQLEAAAAQKDQAAAAADKAVRDLADTSLNSPMSGVILKKLMNGGETAAAGYPVVVIGRTDEVYIEVGVPDEQINQIKYGQSADVSVYGIDTAFKGSVSGIGALADSNTRTFTVKIRVKNPTGELKPGMIASVILHTGSQKAVLIPLDSVLQRADGNVVFVYNSVSNTVSRRIVTTGEIRDNSIEILSGLEFGDQIVTEGQFLLYDGDSVQLAGEVQP